MLKAREVRNRIDANNDIIEGICVAAQDVVVKVTKEERCAREDDMLTATLGPALPRDSYDPHTPQSQILYTISSMIHTQM